MNSKTEPSGNFIEKWLHERRSDDRFDVHIIRLIDDCLTEKELLEQELLRQLIELSDVPEGENETD